MADDSGGRRKGPSDLSELGARLDRARARDGGGPAADRPDRSGYGRAFQVSAEMIAGIAVGGGAGWALDRWLGTAPWLLVAGLPLGFAAGLLNVFRSLGMLPPRGRAGEG